MAAASSAGILLYRGRSEADLHVYLVHPGGPFFARKDAGAWSIPKGLVQEGEDPLAAARRELFEETGITAEGPFIALGEVRQKGGKAVAAWAGRYLAAELPPLCSNSFEIEWPPKSGRRQQFPEVDRGEFFALSEAHIRINAAQREFLTRLAAELSLIGQ